jgi:hypothetical protein
MYPDFVDSGSSHRSCHSLFIQKQVVGRECMNVFSIIVQLHAAGMCMNLYNISCLNAHVGSATVVILGH